ncbi:hypothetical protein J3459_020090 [Metarhizium acridum]|uniref:RTA1 domain protein, putative n=1 Tax=Metarhizium acridum (strain CQMa 102) TaxID=655827 RepID=E9DUG9_METAQ|nr:RTA1 domain protein, putative [Metarhizium acridum CQMa 102]EFY92631.1 RTA1 domain protein, putative [Metarhizium acridum CQMa 102]KAG8405905.1 hypothetical protein J3459_020090 [Metarhizium acridum]
MENENENGTPKLFRDQRLRLHYGCSDGILGLASEEDLGHQSHQLTLIFVWLDIVCFLVQGGGGSMLYGDSSAGVKNIGIKMYTAGIGLQLGHVVIFTGMTLFFYWKMRRVTGRHVRRMGWLIWTMLLVLAMIVAGSFVVLVPGNERADGIELSQMRIIFRLVEFGPGLNHYSPMLGNETYPFMLDAFPMLVAFVALSVMHPGYVLRGPDGDFPRLTRAEKKAIRQQKKEEEKRTKEGCKEGTVCRQAHEY